MGSIPESGRSPGKGNGNPLQYSCLGNSRDIGGWWASVHGITKSLTNWKTTPTTCSKWLGVCGKGLEIQYKFKTFPKRNGKEQFEGWVAEPASMNDFGFSIRSAAVGVDAGCWLPLIYFLKMKQRCNTGGNRAHPHDQEKSSGNSEADEVRVGGSSFYKGTLGDSIQPLLPGKSGLGFQLRPGAPSMQAWGSVCLVSSYVAMEQKWNWVPSKSGSHLGSGSQK